MNKVKEEIEIFGLKELGKKVPELLMKKVKNRNNPSQWSWVPSKPEKIRNTKRVVREERKSLRYAAITNYNPTNIRQRIVLLFASGTLNYGFLNNLEQDNVKFFYLNFVQFVLKGKVTIRYEKGIQKNYLAVEDAELDLDDVSCVIWNPPRFPMPIIDFDSIPAKTGRHNYMFKKRWMQLLKEIYIITQSHSTWIPGSPFNGSQEWQNKIGELKIAHNIGLNIPPTLLTNDIKELNEFAKKHGDTLLLREFGIPPFSFPPAKINIEKTDFSKLIKSPCCFQKYINKKYELRVVVLFDRVYPAKIYSQDSPLTRDDWRVHDDENVKWELVTLPQSISDKLIKLSKALNLNWCSIDLIYGEDDKYYYLEANRPGAHYWLDLFVGLDITKEIVLQVLFNKLADKTKS